MKKFDNGGDNSGHLDNGKLFHAYCFGYCDECGTRLDGAPSVHEGLYAYCVRCSIDRDYFTKEEIREITFEMI